MKEVVWGSVFACIACVLIVVYAAFGIPYIEYCKAVSLQASGKVVEAYDAFAAMGDYKDAEERAASLYEQYKVEKFENATVGDVLYFGTYEQDNNPTNGKEDIQWRILDIVDGKALVVSACGLSCKQYHTRDENVTWEDCALRGWLNEVFWNEAFSAEEKELILTTTVSVDINLVNKQDQGNPTEDKVFILSLSELETYLEEPDARRSRATERAVAEGAFIDTISGNGWYWTRTSARYSNEVKTIDSYGCINKFGDGVAEKYYTVRPAIWINLGN